MIKGRWIRKRDLILSWPAMTDMALIDILRPHGIAKPHLTVVVIEGSVAYKNLVQIWPERVVHNHRTRGILYSNTF